MCCCGDKPGKGCSWVEKSSLAKNLGVTVLNIGQMPHVFNCSKEPKFQIEKDFTIPPQYLMDLLNPLL